MIIQCLWCQKVILKCNGNILSVFRESLVNREHLVVLETVDLLGL